MKIVHVLAPALSGGLERVVHALAVGQHRVGHRVMVAPLVEQWSTDHPFAAPLARAGVDVRPIVLPPRAYRAERARLRCMFSAEAPDVVHTHGYHADVVAGDLARRAGAAAVSTAHGFTRGTLRNRLYERVDRIALRRFDAVVAVSRSLADELARAGISHGRVHVVQNAWSRIVTPLTRADARRDLGLRPDRFTVGWVGRMTREKGLDVFIDALAGLLDLPIDACIIGAGPDRAGQEARAAAVGLRDRVHWCGLVREAGRFFAAFDLLVLSSRTEGVPMVVLEAMAEQVPLVASSVGGIPQVLSEDDALLVPPERPDALASAIRSAFVDRAGAHERAAHALRRLEWEFAESHWLRRYDEVYEAASAIAAVRSTA